MINYLTKLKEKCKIDNKLFEIINDIFEKLIDFSYISKSQAKKLQKKLYNNIDTILVGNEINIDYKSGYYDAVKKELYIKDISNIETVYLRILYALSTTEISKDTYSVGYSTSSMSNSDYKIRHKNFGINRAVTSNLACRLLYTVPTTLSIMPTYRTYENDFLGNKISSDNDIYFLEGKLFAQICYILDVSEEELYNNLFTSPNKFLSKFSSKISNNLNTDLLELLDTISKNYSAYNKLVYFNRCLNENYINTRKKLLENNTESLKREKENIKLAITNALIKISNKYDTEDDDIFINIEDSLSEEISSLEECILKDISNLQNILVDYLICNKQNYSSISYAIKLKELDKVLIIKNKNLKEEIYKTLTIDLMNTFENTATNIIEKIKYSIINEIISSDKYIKIYKNMQFKRLNNINCKENCEVVAITVDNEFIQLISVDNLDYNMKGLDNNTHSITLNNMGYLLNTPSVTKDIQIYEKLFTIIHTKFPKFSNVHIENMYFVKEDTFSLVIILQDGNFDILQIIQNDSTKLNLKLIKLSEAYTIFNLNNNLLPTLYKKHTNPFQKLFSTFFFT